MNQHEHNSTVAGPNFEAYVYQQLLAAGKFDAVRPATATEQRVGHIDIVATLNGVEFRIECKSIKDNDYTRLVLEGRTVCNFKGETHPGSLFGTATTWAYELNNSRILYVPAGPLKKYAERIDWDSTPELTRQSKHKNFVPLTRTGGRPGDPMIAEQVAVVDFKTKQPTIVTLQTRGDRIAYVPASDIQALPGAYIV